MKALIGVDTGGTFTDAVVITGDGRLYTGKHPTTRGDLVRGILGAIEVAADRMGTRLPELLAAADVTIGTTAGINTLITRTGARVGFITTMGFEDTLLIGRGKLRIAGLDEEACRAMPLTHKPEPLVPRSMTRGVEERIDMFGDVVMPMREDDVRQAVRYLIGRGAEVLVISFLWSFVNDAHERRAAQIARELAADIPVLLSCEVCPQQNEYPRGMTCVINGYIYPNMRDFFGRAQEQFGAAGYDGRLLTMTNDGGVRQWNMVHPVYTINSGPVGGVVAGVELARRYGLPNVVCTDVGGTSFDVAVLRGGQYTSDRIRTDPPVLDRYHVLSPMIDVVSIGAAGGTMAWVDPLTRTLRVGPQSAGSDPGPVCYGRGGTRATVTDANLVLGRLNPANFLGGRMSLDVDAARRALAELGAQIGLDAIGVAEGMIRIVDHAMADLLIKNMVMRGYSPEEFVCFAYGGGGPAHAAAYARLAGFRKVVSLHLAPVWSALGVSAADLLDVHTSSRPLPWPVSVAQYNQTFADLRDRALTAAGLQGVSDGLLLEFSLEMKYARTEHEVTLKGLPEQVSDPAVLDGLRRQFELKYTEVYGKGTVVPGAPVEVSAFRVESRHLRGRAPFAPEPLGPADAGHALMSTRPVYFTGAWHEAGIYAMERLTPGNVVPGPAIIEAAYSTIVVPPDAKALLDGLGNVEITW